MNRTLSAFALTAVLAGALMALSLAAARHGYPYGIVGIRRLDSIADAGNFIPLSAVYFFSAMLMMLLPIRAAGIVLTNAADALFWTAIALFSAIVGCTVARWAFGQSNALWTLWNWRFLLVAAVAACHLIMNDLRRNILLRSLAFAGFAAATLVCLFWSFDF